MTINASAFDTGGIAKIEIYFDGYLLVNTCTSKTVCSQSGMFVPGTHTFSAKAYDAAGNSATSPQKNFTVIADTTPPSVALITPQAGATVGGNAVTVSVNAYDNVPGTVGVQFLLDGANIGSEITAPPYSISWNASLATNATHVLSARARDTVGNSAVSLPVSVTVSNSGPSVTTSYTPSAPTTQTGVVLQATAIGANISGGSFYVDGVKQSCNLGYVNAGSFGGSCALTLTAGNHTLYATAVNTLGFTGTSPTVIVSVTAVSSDTTAPTVSISAPASGTKAAKTITLSAQASDNVGVVGVQFKSNNGGISNIGAEVTTPPYNVSLNTAQLPNGGYNFFATARDAAGNIGTAALTSISIDNTGPTFSPSIIPASPTPNISLTINGYASDPGGLSKIEVYLDGTLQKTCSYASNSGTGGTACTAQVTFSSTGSHTYEIRATDVAGNSATTGQLSFTVSASTDTTAPTVPALTATGGGYGRGTVTLFSQSTDNVGVVGIQFLIGTSNIGSEVLNQYPSAGSYFQAPGSLNTTQYVDGSYLLYAVARDAAGNTAKSVAVQLKIDNTPPAPSVSVTPVSPSSGATTTISSVSSDASGIVKTEIYIDGALQKTCSGGFGAGANCSLQTTLSSGSHTYEVRATDGAGNVGTKGPASITVAYVGSASQIASAGSEQYLASVSMTLQGIAQTLEMLTNIIGSR